MNHVTFDRHCGDAGDRHGHDRGEDVAVVDVGRFVPKEGSQPRESSRPRMPCFRTVQGLGPHHRSAMPRAVEPPSPLRHGEWLRARSCRRI